MKKRFLLISLWIFCFCGTYCQDSTLLRRNAIRIERQDSLGDNIYDALAKYQLIMVGESHGTNEPARFVMSLTDLFTKKGYRVQIGLEIPSEQMKRFMVAPSDSNIYASDFFVTKRHDSRASLAWAQLIEKSVNNPDVEFFYFDINTINNQTFEARDSLMYLKIKERIFLHSSWKTITLSGNVHNRISLYNGKIKMGLYLRADKDLNIKNKMLSVDHVYESGEHWDNSGEDIHLVQDDHSDAIFSRAVDYENYLFIYPADAGIKYSSIYFTRKVTPSNLAGSR